MFAFVVFVSVFQYWAKRLAGKNVYEMTYFVSGGSVKPYLNQLTHFKTVIRNHWLFVSRTGWLCYRGQYFDKHLKFIHHNENPVPFTKLDLSYLLKVRLSHRIIEALIQALSFAVFSSALTYCSLVYWNGVCHVRAPAIASVVTSSQNKV